MRKLFLVLYKYRVLLVFVFLEIVALIMVRKNNAYHSAAFYTSSNEIVGSFLQSSHNLAEYFSLDDKNNQLLSENAALRKQLDELNLKLKYQTFAQDTFHMPDSSMVDSLASTPKDTVYLDRYSYIPAEVINNSVYQVDNYMTIDKGALDGIEVGMGVMTNTGVVGRVKSCSNHLATVISLLHSRMTVSSMVKRNNTLCTTKWDYENYKKAKLQFVSRHMDVVEGDTIMSSGFNAVFPKGTMIGVVEKVEVIPSESFKTVTLHLSTDFSELSYVYVVKDAYKQEFDSLAKLQER